MINTQLKFEGKVKNVQKLLHSQFEGQFDLEDQGQGHKFLEWSKTFRWSIHSSSLKVKFLQFKSCCIHKESHKCFSFKVNLTLKVKVKITSLQPYLRHLDA